MSQHFVQILRHSAAAVGRATDQFGLFFLLALGLGTAGASLLAGV
jgi:hypothetical protein